MALWAKAGDQEQVVQARPATRNETLYLKGF